MGAPMIKANNKWTCPARWSNDGGTVLGGGITVNVAGTSAALAENVTNTTQWWCTSGRNNQAAFATPANSIQVFSFGVHVNGNGDPRTELMLTNCRQDDTACGGVAVIPAMTAVGTGAATQSRVIVRASMTNITKCTWIHASEKGAPTFKAEIGETSGPVLNVKFDLHYAEYNTGLASQPTRGTNNLYYPHCSWTTLKARMYDLTQFTGKIEQPNAWMFSDAAITSGAGALQKRWFPVSLAT